MAGMEAEKAAVQRAKPKADRRLKREGDGQCGQHVSELFQMVHDYLRLDHIPAPLRFVPRVVEGVDVPQIGEVLLDDDLRGLYAQSDTNSFVKI